MLVVDLLTDILELIIDLLFTADSGAGCAPAVSIPGCGGAKRAVFDSLATLMRRAVSGGGGRGGGGGSGVSRGTRILPSFGVAAPTATSTASAVSPRPPPLPTSDTTAATLTPSPSPPAHSDGQGVDDAHAPDQSQHVPTDTSTSARVPDYSLNDQPVPFGRGGGQGMRDRGRSKVEVVPLGGTAEEEGMPTGSRPKLKFAQRSRITLPSAAELCLLEVEGEELEECPLVFDWENKVRVYTCVSVCFTK